MFGNPETTTGGNALKFYSSVRLDIRRTATIKNGDEAIGNRTKVKVVKNKVAPPFKIIEFDIMYGEGISQTGDILDLSVNQGIVEKAGAWFSYDNAKIGQGRENAKTFLKENPEIMNEIKTKVLAKHGLAEDPDASFVDESTGEILEETSPKASTTKTKKSRKTIQ